MSKTIVETEVGGDGAKAGLYVDGEELSVKISYPTSKILEPIAQVADKAIDQLDQWIPGDQKAIADKLKLELRAELASLLSKQLAN